jgi:hypothetical protein
MKKSEFVERRKRYWEAEDIAAAEAAGVVWDPEEEPLAERLYVVDSLTLPGDSMPAWLLSTVAGDSYLTKETAQAAADLYNRRGNIARVARELRASAHYGERRFEGWADYLEGK